MPTKVPQPPPTVTPAMLDSIRAHVVPFACACFTDHKLRPIKAFPHQALMAFVLMRPWLGHSVIVAPPEHAKTWWAGNFFVSWSIGINPDIRIGYASISENHAKRQSLNIRDIITGNDRYQALFPAITPSRTRGWNQTQWFVNRENDNDPNPTFQAVGMGSAFTGSRFDLLLFDDVNDIDQQRSDTQRADALNWCLIKAMTRVPEEGRAITIQTRWHEEDWAGHCIKSGWTYLHFRALAEGDDTSQYGALTVNSEELANRVAADLAREGWLFTQSIEPVLRHEGKATAHVFRVLLHRNGPALWPENRSSQSLLHTRDKSGISSQAFACTFQGTPAPENGNVIAINKFRRYPHVVPPAGPWLQKVQSWDTAFSTKTSADYTVGQTWGLARDGTMWLLDQVRKRLSFYDLKAEVAKAYAKHMPDLVLVEDNGSGQSLIQEMHHSQDLGIGRVPIIGIRALKDKEVRTRAVSGHIEAERVWIPDGGEWVDDFVRECAYFPNDTHDDQVDAMTLALTRLTQISIESQWADDDRESHETLVGAIWNKVW